MAVCRATLQILFVFFFDLGVLLSYMNFRAFARE